MQLNVSGHHVEVTEAMRGYVESKIERLERHFDIVSNVHCILTVEKLRHKAEAKVNVNGGTIAMGFGGNPKEPTAMRGGPMFEFLFGLDTWLRKQGTRETPRADSASMDHLECFAILR